MAGMSFMGAAGGSFTYEEKNRLHPSRIDVQPKRKIIPKGAKQYFFNSAGQWDNGEQSSVKAQDRVFDCVARTDVAARVKYEKWVAQQ